MSELSKDHVATERSDPSLTWIIFASSSGSLIEWYDFYVYLSMAVFLGNKMFPASAHNGMFGLLLSMFTLGLGFAIRPFGGLLFGSLGDRIGRKYTFLATLIIMGITTTAIGLLPTYSQVGFLAPLCLLSLRVLQGLAIGGDFGASTTYVVEYVQDRQRGLYCGLLIAMSPLGTILSVGVVWICRHAVDGAAFDAWGWRLPFLFSGLLLIVSLYLRLRLKETPVFKALARFHETATSPVRELFLNRKNLGRMLVAIFGASAGQSAIAITAMAYSMSFMQAMLKVSLETASGAFFVGAALGIPFYVVFGWLSDKIGRRPLIIVGSIIAIISYIPIYTAMRNYASPPNFAVLAFLSWLQVMFVAMTMGPATAFIAEMFSARVRTTATGVTFNISNGLLNGFALLLGFWLISRTGNIYAGLAYPMFLATLTVIVNLLFAEETYQVNIHDVEDGLPARATPVRLAQSADA